jgi:hypothetical protein
MGIPVKDYINIFGHALIIWLKTKAIFYTIGFLIILTFINLVEDYKPKAKESNFDKLFEESQELEPDRFVIELELIMKTI